MAGGMCGRGACMAGGMCGSGACIAGGVCGKGGVRGRKNGKCSGRYASYWNAFLLNSNFYTLLTKSSVEVARNHFRNSNSSVTIF